MKIKTLSSKLFAGITAVLATLALASTPALAQDYDNTITKDIPTFASCSNPGGTQIAGYESGIHQIPGNGLLSGSDFVYRVGDNLFVQCFCPDNNCNHDTGIQSNWIHESYLSSEQQQYLVNIGWLRIENGPQWGLPEGTYYVNNILYACQEDQNPDHQKPDYSWKHHDWHHNKDLPEMSDKHPEWQMAERRSDKDARHELREELKASHQELKHHMSDMHQWKNQVQSNKWQAQTWNIDNPQHQQALFMIR